MQLRYLGRSAGALRGAWPQAQAAIHATQQRGAETAAAALEDREPPYASMPRRQDTSLLLPRFKGLLVDAAGSPPSVERLTWSSSIPPGAAGFRARPERHLRQWRR